jgi:methionine synthase I (cobalamin-dependent)
VTPDDFAALLREGVLLLDGGMGSLLIAAGLQQGTAPEAWLFERPEAVLDAHRAYAEAGSDVLHTNTFGGTPPKLKASGLEGRCAVVSRRAVELARQAASGRALVAGDMGPTGLMRPPVGQASEEDYFAAYAEQAAALTDAGADLLSIETQYDLTEALAAVRAAVATGLPVLASMTFEKKKRGFFTIMGDPLSPSLRRLAEAGAHAVGLNCSVTSSVMLEMVLEVLPALTMPLAAQPNAGQPRVTPDGVTYDADPEAFARDLLAMARAGARLLGGCCGTGPAFVREARRLLGSENLLGTPHA